MRWLELLLRIDAELTSGDAVDADVRGVQYDSRRVSASDVFVAMRGATTDGNGYIDAATRRGAVAVVTDSAEKFAEIRANNPALPVVLAGPGHTAGRRALAQVSSALFGAPERELKISAVTGTNGKTTTAFLLEQMLRSVGRKCVLLGTIETHVAGEVRASEHTTPESRDVLAVFAEGVAAGCTEAIMEMSSHALEQERVWGLPVDVAIFTNLTQDHLDYHGTMKAYARAKARLFAGVGARLAENCRDQRRRRVRGHDDRQRPRRALLCVMEQPACEPPRRADRDTAWRDAVPIRDAGRYCGDCFSADGRGECVELTGRHVRGAGARLDAPGGAERRGEP